MRVFEYIEYAVSPEVKIGICFLLLAAIIVVYLWDPIQRQKVKPKEKGIMRQLEVNPKEYAKQDRGWYKKRSNRIVKENDQTLVQLQQYVKALHEEKIHNVDDV